jgi:hypothetical protein
LEANGLLIVNHIGGRLHAQELSPSDLDAMDDFVALLIAVAASIAGVMLVRLTSLSLAFAGAGEAWLAMSAPAQAVIGIAAAVVTYRRAARIEAAS